MVSESVITALLQLREAENNIRKAFILRTQLNLLPLLFFSFFFFAKISKYFNKHDELLKYEIEGCESLCVQISAVTELWKSC